MMKTTTAIDPPIQDHMLLFTQLYPAVYTQTIPQQGVAKRRNRKKKNKGESKSIVFKKRKLTAEQVNFLEINFGNEHKLESERKDRIASELGLDPRQVAVWFQNRRARWKNKKLEDEYSKLKKNHDNIVVEKCSLESEVIKLKEQLCEAKIEIQRLSEQSEMNSSNSPSSSLSMEAPFLGEYGIQGYEEDVLYMQENEYVNYMEWINQYM